MIIEINEKLLGIPEKVNLNQLVFLSIVLDKNQKKNNQSVQKIVSLISDDEILYLIQQGLITSIERSNSITYQETEKLEAYVTPDHSYFDLFYEMYPVYSIRPSGEKTYLRANKNKCRNLYNNYIKGTPGLAEHINNCLSKEIDKKAKLGKLSYMKTMWRWLQDHHWEEIEEEMLNEQEQANKSDYGAEII